MNRYRFEDIFIGLEEAFEVILPEKKLKLFEELTGDKNPLHTDEEYAKKENFGGRVAYGMLTASYLSTLAGMYLPGERSIIHEVNVKFLHPLIMKDERRLWIKGKVTELDERFRIFTLKIEITDDSNIKVCRGKMRIGVR